MILATFQIRFWHWDHSNWQYKQWSEGLNGWNGMQRLVEVKVIKIRRSKKCEAGYWEAVRDRWQTRIEEGTVRKDGQTNPEKLGLAVADSDRFSNIIVSWKQWCFRMISVAAVCRVFQKKEWVKITWSWAFLSNLFARSQRTFWNDFLETESGGVFFSLFFLNSKCKKVYIVSITLSEKQLIF